MPSTILFSNASFDKPAQATVTRSIESVKRKTLEDDTLNLYINHCSNNKDKIEKEETLVSGKSILESVDNYVEHKSVNTIVESQTNKINFTSNVNSPSIKKRKLKIIPNKIDVAVTVDAKNKTVDLMTKVSIYFKPMIFNVFHMHLMCLLFILSKSYFN